MELALVQQLARPRRFMIGMPALRIFGDVSVDQIEFVMSFIRRVGVGDVSLASAQRLYFGAGEHQPRLELVLDRVVEAGLAILGDELAALALLRHRLDLCRPKRGTGRLWRALRRPSPLSLPQAAPTAAVSRRSRAQASQPRI